MSKTIKMCPTCSVSFSREVGPGYDRGGGKWCSRACYGVAFGLGQRGENNPTWNGGRTVMKSGHVRALAPDHPHANKGYVFEHRLMVERVIGRYLRREEVVHHVNVNPGDNRNANFVLCPNESYHQLLHARMRVVKRGGNPNTHHVCNACDQVLPHESFSTSRERLHGRYAVCRDCWNRRTRERKAAKKEAQL